MSGCEVTSVCTLNIAREPVFVFTIESQWGGGGRRGSWVETYSWSLKLTKQSLDNVLCLPRVGGNDYNEMVQI